MEWKFEQHVRSAVELDARARIAGLLKYLVAVPDLSARNYLDACVTRPHHSRNLLTDRLLIGSSMNSVEHMMRRDYGLNPIGRGRPAHCDRLFQGDRAIISLRQYVAMNINHSIKFERLWRNGHAVNLSFAMSNI